MAIEELPGGGTVVTGPDTRTFQLLALAHAAALEITTGLRASRLPLTQMARNAGVIPADGSRPQKRKILKLTVQKLRDIRPDYEPSASVAKALIK